MTGIETSPDHACVLPNTIYQLAEKFPPVIGINYILVPKDLVAMKIILANIVGFPRI
jgi:hypothetical protein